MTASPGLPVISCPTSLVASCAPLLGHEPRRCVVGFIGGVPGRTGAVVVRVDLVDSPGLPRAAERLADSIAGTGGTLVDLVAWVDDSRCARSHELSSAPMLELVADALAARGVRVRTLISTADGYWWNHDCRQGCCDDAVPLDDAILTGVRAEYAFAGYAPLRSREALADRIAPDHARVRTVRRSLDAARPPADLERWRDAQVTFLTTLLVPGGDRGPGSRGMGVRARRQSGVLAPAVAARALRGLRDVAVRDTVLLRLVGCSEEDRGAWHRTIDLLCEVVRCAPAGAAAPAATLLGIVCWMTGEGALASVALDRARADNPWYRLADLTREVISRGIDPDLWRRSMSGLTEAECRGAGQRP